MFRAVISAFLGYAAMVACVVASIAGLWYAFGNGFAFAGDTTSASTQWSLAVLACGLMAAVIGGCVAAMLGGPKGGLAVRVLIGMILIFGILSLVTQSGSDPIPLPPGKSVQDLDFVDAGRYAVSPMWYNVAVVVAGGIGVWFGGRLCLGRFTVNRETPLATTPQA